MKTQIIIKLLLFGAVLSFRAEAIETVVDQDYSGVHPIIIVPFSVAKNAQVNPSDIISFDLTLSGKFKVVSRGKLPARPDKASDIDFERFAGLGSTYAVVGRIKASVLDVELVDLAAKKTLDQYRAQLKSLSATTIRAASHGIADRIYEKLIGVRGAFKTKIAYVTVSKNDNGKLYTLETMGIDGKDSKVVFRSDKLIMSPCWAPSGKYLAYVSFEHGKSEVWAHSLISGKRGRLAAFKGSNSAPAWSPDGENVALSLSKDGNPEIYVLNIQSGETKRITGNNAADTEPAWSPDGKSLYFLSDRQTSPQIYKVTLGEGEMIKKITASGAYNTSPDISQDGNSMAFLRRTDSGYQTAIMDFASGAIKIISKTGNDASPSFSPNGQMVVYATKKGGKEVLVVTDKNGAARQVLNMTAKNMRDPSWSPYLRAE